MFENVKKGHKVYDVVRGEGVVDGNAVTDNSTYPVRVIFCDNEGDTTTTTETYTMDGRYYIHHKYPALFLEDPFKKPKVKPKSQTIQEFINENFACVNSDCSFNDKTDDDGMDCARSCSPFISCKEYEPANKDFVPKVKKWRWVCEIPGSMIITDHKYSGQEDFEAKKGVGILILKIEKTEEEF